MHSMKLMELKDRIKRQFSTPRTPQKNGVVERKNRFVQEAARNMLNEAKLLDIYWRESLHTYSAEHNLELAIKSTI